MIPLLLPLFQGARAPAGEALVLTHTPPLDAVPVAALLREPTLIDELLRRHAQKLGVAGPDLRATASSWCFAYLDALLPTVALAATVLQHVFPVHPEAIAVRFSDAASARAFYIRHEGHLLPGANTLQRFGSLLDSHLTPLFALLAQQARVPPKILWGNLARRLDSLFTHALALTQNAPHVAQDRELLLNASVWFDGQPNPLRHKQRTVIPLHRQATGPITLHRQCCLFYRLPGEDYCAACPLAPANQAPRTTIGGNR